MKTPLATSYMGIDLASPILVGSCPLTIELEATRRMVEAGAGAIVLPSILQEQLVHAHMSKFDPIAAAEQSGHFPQQDRYNGGPEEYLKTIQKMKETYSIPIIASIHGATIGPWLEYAKEIEAKGADALELNWQMGRKDPKDSSAEIEAKMLEWVADLRARIAIPIAVKMANHFTNPASIAHRLQEVGVNGLTLFCHRPTWDVDNDRMHWTTSWELSPVGSLGGTLEGIVATRTDGLNLDIAASGGVRTGDDAIKTMIAGARVVMMVSEIYRQGPDAIRAANARIQQFLNTNHCGSLQAFQLASANAETKPEHLTRSEIVDPLTSTSQYYDPTPVPRQIRGDRFGHPLADN